MLVVVREGTNRLKLYAERSVWFGRTKKNSA